MLLEFAENIIVLITTHKHADYEAYDIIRLRL